jgi:hypothetical protein
MKNTSKQAALHGALVVIVLGVAACGGGGGGGGGRNATNAPPVLGSAVLSTKQNKDLQGQVSATDPTGDALTFTVTANPTSGTLVSFSPSGAFVYRPAQGFLGDDTFRVQVSDSGNSITGVVNINVHPNRAPVAASDAVRADGAALAKITVLDNDTDADSDPLTVMMEEGALAGTATVNADSSISISSLPTGFKGVTRFKYRVTDSDGASAIGTAAVFVGVEPFRVVVAGDPEANGSPELFMSDFVADPTVLTAATEGDMRLRGFTASENGKTVAYRRENRNNASSVDLGFVRTAAPIQRETVPLPAGATLPLASNAEQFIVSPDGQWIALIARVASVDAVYVVNVTTPTALTKVSPATAVFASRLRFSRDSQRLFFLASPVAGGGSKSLYTVTPTGPSATVPVSAISDPATTDDVLDYSIAANQTSILIDANRGGRQALFFIDARQLQTETQVSHSLADGESIRASTISLAGGTIGGRVGQRVGYTVVTDSLTTRAYVAEISATSNPREVATAAEVVGLRPDDNALLYIKGGQIYEHDLVTVGADTIVAAGGTAWYDSTGNIVLVQQAQFAGPTPYPVLAVTTRGAFGAAQPLGTPAQAARFSEVSGFDRGVALIAEGPPQAAPPARARVALVNALAPDKLLYLGNFESPLQLTSSPALVVAR